MAHGSCPAWASYRSTTSVRSLKRIGYDGPCSIELFRPEYWNWDPQELAIKAREAALKVLSPHFQIE